MEVSYLITLAGVTAALDALAAEASDAQTAVDAHAGARRRGGDPKAAERAERDAALRNLAQLLTADLSLEARAARVISKVSRYRPAPGDETGAAERKALRRIADTGLPTPGTRQLRRILEGPV